MKIVHIAPYYPPHVGGLQQAVRNLATAQALQGHSVTVITARVPRQADEVETPGLEVRRLWTLEIAHTPLMPTLLLSLFRHIRPGTAVHVHFAQAYVAEIVALYSWLTGHPYVLHYHGDSLPAGRLGKLLPLYKRYLLARSLRRAAAIVYPTAAFQQHVTKQFSFLSSKPHFVIPNGIQPSTHAPAARHDTKFLYAGRLSRVKNVDLIITAFVAARDEASGIELHIVGGGGEEPSLRTLVDSLGAQSYIHFLGNLDKDELDKHYVNSVVFLVASQRESFGLGVVEAMAAGLPVVAFDVPGVRQIVEHGTNGLLIAPFDTYLYADAIALLATDPDLRRRYAENAADAAKPFDYLKVASHYDSIDSWIFTQPGKH